jgi:C1A family cysteine protease
MARKRWLASVLAGMIVLTIAAFGLSCAGTGKSAQAVFTPTDGAPVASEPNTTVPGYWAGVVPWEPAAGVVEVTTAPQAELAPGDGKFTQAVAEIPFVAPPETGAHGTSSLAGSAGFYYAEHVSPSEVQGQTFDPASSPAFACYELALPAGAPLTIGVAWYSLPTDLDGYFIGIGDLAANKWHWYPGPDDGVLTFDPSAWGGQASSRVLVCVALRDGKLADFWQLKAGVHEVRGTGLEYEEPKQVKTISSVDVSAAGSLPSAVDLSADYLHPVRNQGSMGSCTAFACTDACLSILLNQVYGSQGWDTTDNALKPSPMWAYVRSGIAPIGSWSPVCGSSVGRYMSEAFNVLEQVGAAMEATVPYVATNNCSTTFPAQAQTEASLVKISDWYSLSGSGMADAVKLHLGMFNRPLVISMLRLEYTFMNYSSGVYQFNPNGAWVNGGHAMCIVGYDDSLQAFKVRNSWGSSWGQQGYWWCSYSSVDQMVQLGRMYVYVEELEFNQAAASHFLGVAPINIDEVEPNNYPVAANVLPAFPVAGYSGQLGGEDGADCFLFNYRAGYATDFAVVMAGSLRVQLELYTPDGVLIYSPAGSEAGNTISGQWTQDGQAILQVQWLSGQGYYTLNAGERCPPPVPAGFVASDGTQADGVALRWNAVTGAQSYKVERATEEDGPFTEIASTFGTTYNDTAAEQWRYFYYRVRASNAGGASLPSATDQGSRQAPAPGNVQATDGTMDRQVKIAWQAIPGGGAVYTVRRSLFREGPYSVLGTTTVQVYADERTDDLVPYYYTVNATKNGYAGPASAPDSGYRREMHLDPGQSNQQHAIKVQPGQGSGSLEPEGTAGLEPDRVTVEDGEHNRPPVKR